jgi:hypothetical protein
MGKVAGLTAMLLISLLVLAGCGSTATSNWTNTGGGLSKYSVMSFAYDSAHDVLYAGTASHGVWRCDSPRTSPGWTDMGGGVASYGIYALAYDPARDLVYAGGFKTDVGANSVMGGVWRCASPRASPRWIDTGGSLGSFLVYALAYDAARDILYAGTDRGIWRSLKPDGQPSWSGMGGGLKAFPVKSLAHDPTRNVLYAGGDNMVGGSGGVWYCNTPDGAPAWLSTTGDFNGTGVDALAYDSKRDVLYAGTSGTGVRRCTSPRAAPSWTSMSEQLIKSGGPNAAVALAYDSAGDALFMGGYEAGGLIIRHDSGVWRCANPEQSDTWKPSGTGIRRFDISSMAFVPANGVMFAGVGPSQTLPIEGQGVWRYELPPLKK